MPDEQALGGRAVLRRRAGEPLPSANAEFFIDGAPDPLAPRGSHGLAVPDMTRETGTLRLHGDTLAREGLLDFAVNVWPGSQPVSLRRALERALRHTGYPDQRPAVEAIARRHGRSPDEVLLLNGACEAFWLLAHALRPATAICLHPSFTEPEAALRAVGAEITQAIRERADFVLDPTAVPTHGEIVVLGNPNNPTGTLDQADRILELTRPGRLLVVDESFIDFVSGERESLASRGDVSGLVVVRSLTKLWSLAAVRAGYLLAQPALVELLSGQRQPWSVNGPACAALALCPTDRHTRHRRVAAVTEARKALVEQLEHIAGVKVWPSAANFLLLEVPNGPLTVARLERAGIAVRPASSFPGLSANHLRVAVRHDVDNRRLVGALRRALDEQGDS